MDKQLLVDIGKRIHQRRKALGYTQEQLAELMIDYCITHSGD